jgi:hypothetical protein
MGTAMKWLHRLQRHLEPFAIPNLTLILIAGMVAVALLSAVDPRIGGMLELIPGRVARGEVWRLVTFLFTPAVGITSDPVSILFFVMFLGFLNTMGTALEASWGTARYTLFVLLSVLASLVSAMLGGWLFGADAVGSNLYLYGSIFLAFAWLFPEYEILLFFVLPVKVKWLALLTIVITALQFAAGVGNFTAGGWLTCGLILAAHANLALFIGPDVVARLRHRPLGGRPPARFRAAAPPRHTCVVCGATNLSHPDRDFRYCPECDGTPAYCNEHLAGHAHRGPPTERSARG